MKAVKELRVRRQTGDLSESQKWMQELATQAKEARRR